MLLLGNNAPLLRLHKVLAGQPTARVLRRAVIDLRLCAHRRHLLRATIHLLTTIHVLLLASSVVGHYILYAEILPCGPGARHYIGSLGVFPDRISS